MTHGTGDFELTKRIPVFIIRAQLLLNVRRAISVVRAARYVRFDDNST